MKVNNELVRAIDELRDAKAMQKFGMKFDELGKVNKDEQKAVSKIYPLNISEAEPRRITAGAGK